METFLKIMKYITHREFPIKWTQKMQEDSIFTTKMQKFSTKLILLKHIVKLMGENRNFSGVEAKIEMKVRGGGGYATHGGVLVTRPTLGSRGGA